MSARTSGRVNVFGIDIDRVTLQSAAVRLTDWVEQGERNCRYVVTPNLDHVMLYRDSPALREAYGEASLVVADGWPLVTASRLFRKEHPLPERVAGSDLVPGLFSEIQRRGATRRVFLLGAAPGVGDCAAAAIHRRWTNVEVVCAYSPPMGFQDHSEENHKIVNLINEHSPDVLVVGFGAPKQELWLKQHRSQIQAGVALAGGATIDFLAGRQKRAPVWMRKMRLEWTHRLMTNPRRLAKRYARNFLGLPGLLLNERKNASGKIVRNSN